jgi:toxin CcdB
MVIPLRSLKHFPKVRVATQLTPILKIDGKDYLLETPKMGAVPQHVLKSPVTSLTTSQAKIMAALDFLFQGY